MSISKIYSDQSRQVNWTVREDTDATLTLTVTQSAAAYNLSSTTFICEFFEVNNSTPFLTLTQGAGLTNGGAAGTLVIALTDTQLNLTLNQYFWKLRTTAPTDYLWLNGIFQVNGYVWDGGTDYSVTVALTVANNSISINLVSASTSGGSGTVTSFSAGDLTPLFTTSEATATTTPALTFAQIVKAANLVFAGPTTGIAANPDFRALVAADIPTLTASKLSDFNSAALAAAPAETASTIGVLINGSSAATPNDTDLVGTADTSVLKKITWTNVKAFLKTYFDTLYQATGLAALKANNLSDLASAATARTNLGATTVGGNVFTLTNPSAISYPRINADNSVTALTVAQLRTDLIIDSGTYTPSLTNVTNVDSSTAYLCQYMRVGSVVTVSGRVDIDATTGATLTTIRMSLPVASAITATTQVGGTFACDSAVSVAGSIQSTAATDDVSFFYLNSSAVNNRNYYFSFTYQIL